ncbi:MAG: NADH-quinone oxidoreductase subunit C [Magnetococcus sp. XQGC-1]
MTADKLSGLEKAIEVKFPGLPRQRLGDALVVWVTPGDLVQTMTRLRDDPELDFKLMVDLAGVHYPGRGGGGRDFDLVYQLLSVHRNHRIRVKLEVDDRTLVPSVSGVWSCANWFEREAYDLFGILFSGHPDLRRILNDYDFEGYPLRKDFPVTGLVEVCYDDVQRRVVKKAVDLKRGDREPYRQIV